MVSSRVCCIREHLFQVIIAPPPAGHKPGCGHGPSGSRSLIHTEEDGKESLPVLLPRVILEGTTAIPRHTEPITGQALMGSRGRGCLLGRESQTVLGLAQGFRS